MLYYTGCRISEALAVQHSRIDYSRQGVVFKTLKIFRFVPLPSPYLEKLDDVHHIQDMQKDKASENNKIWNFGRTTGWTTITKVMYEAKIKGIHAVLVWLFIIKAWSHPIILGWKLYGRAIGKEERNLASRLWK